MTLNIELLESSFAKAKPYGLQMTNKFYEILFEEHPEVKNLFANADMEQQSRHLLDSLNLTVLNLRYPDRLNELLKGLGTRHIKYGALPMHYPLVGSALLKAFSATLGDAWTPTIQQAWLDAYGVISQMMLEGADYQPESLIIEPRELIGSESSNAQTPVDSNVETASGYLASAQAQTTEEQAQITEEIVPAQTAEEIVPRKISLPLLVGLVGAIFLIGLGGVYVLNSTDNRQKIDQPSTKIYKP